MTITNHRKIELMQAATAEPVNIRRYRGDVHFSLAGIKVGVNVMAGRVYMPFDQESAAILQSCGVADVGARIYTAGLGVEMDPRVNPVNELYAEAAADRGLSLPSRRLTRVGRH